MNCKVFSNNNFGEIMSSLYPDDMTKEEVMKEAARLLAPTLRRMYDEYEKKEKEQKEKEENEEKNEKANEIKIP